MVVLLMKNTCPICRKPTKYRFRPFCSKNCSNLDLSRWFEGEYRIETEERPNLDDFSENLTPHNKHDVN